MRTQGAFSLFQDVATRCDGMLLRSFGGEFSGRPVTLSALDAAGEFDFVARHFAFVKLLDRGALTFTRHGKRDFVAGDFPVRNRRIALPARHRAGQLVTFDLEGKSGLLRLPVSSGNLSRPPAVDVGRPNQCHVSAAYKVLLVLAVDVSSQGNCRHHKAKGKKHDSGSHRSISLSKVRGTAQFLRRVSGGEG